MQKDKEYEFYHVDESEYDRITYVLSEADFNTGCPNPIRVEKMARAINDYLVDRNSRKRIYM